MNKQRVLDVLRAGNRRYLDRTPREKQRTPAATAGRQAPFCVVLSCADSRVPVEMIFDQDIGDLFVIRVAGNVASEEAVASAEYAVAHLGAAVVMVMGHTACGAVAAARDAAGQLDTLPSDNLRKLVGHIVPSIEATGKGDPETWVDRAVEHNVHRAVERLQASPVIREHVDRGVLEFIEAVYHLDSGDVGFVA